jgi:hypothetical protein
MPIPSVSAGSSADLTVGEQMERLESEYARLANLLSTLPNGPGLDAAFHAIGVVSLQMDEVMGVTEEFRRAEFEAEWDAYAETSRASRAA